MFFRLRRSFSYLKSNFTVSLYSLFLLTIGLFLIISEMSYNASDNSLLNFTDAENGVNNMLGTTGAKIASIVWEAFGYCYLLPAILLLSTAVKFHIYHQHRPQLMLRFSAVFVTFLPLSVLFSYLPHTLDGFGYGGYLGYFLQGELNNVANENMIIAASFALTCSAILYALNITLKEIYYVLKLIAKLLLIAVLYLFALMQVAASKIKLLVMKLKTDSEEMSPAQANMDVKAESATQKVEVKESVISRLQTVRNKVVPSSKAAQSLNAQPKFVFDNNTDFNLPATSLLSPLPQQSDNKISSGMLEQSSRLLSNVLGDFGIKGEILKVSQGPVVTLYEMEPAAGTKSSRVVGLADDIARSMSAISARISVIPGKNAIGIELPNVKRKIVYLRELLESKTYAETQYRLPLILGHNISGVPIIADLAKMPHLLVAGTTGSGKSVAINTMILSLLFKHSPKNCKFIMIDPKMLELSVYDNIPHLLTPVVTEPRKAVSALKWVVQEMESRYRAMSTIGVRNIQGYNEMVEKAASDGRVLTKKIQSGFDPDTGQPIYDTVELGKDTLPLIVVIVDEMADLMLVAGKEIEGSIQRLAQMARAAGIHLIMATQRPSVDVITGVIKANFPTRISFQVTSKIDSRTILGEQGAEQLLGMGDMLFMSGGGRIERVHGPFVSDTEVESIVSYLKKQGQPEYVEDVTSMAVDESDSSGSSSASFDAVGGNEEDIYNQAIKVVLDSKRPSISFVQRSLKIGYNRAANLIERMEKEGIVTPPNNQGKREVI